MYEKKSFVVYVEGIYIKNGKILLVKRANEPFKDFWHIIGGQVEDNETIKNALKREFKEETTLKIKVGEIITGRLEETFDQIKIIITFKVTLAKGKINLNSENEDYGWFHKFPANSVYDYSRYL